MIVSMWPLTSPFSHRIFCYMQLLGVIHVLTGPDHLSAIATLSAVSDPCTSFSLGARWGIGHSTGLLLVGGALIIRDSLHDNSESSGVIDMPDALSHFFESLVGLFMLFLGFFGFRRALRKRREFDGHVSIPGHDDGCEDVMQATQVPEMDLGLEDDISVYCDNPHYIQEARLASVSYEETQMKQSSCLELQASPISAHQRGSTPPAEFGRRFSVRSLALLAGVIHGLAGPGGVLGVIPAVQLHDSKLASLYLISFCLASTFTMGCFAMFYGTCSSGVGKHTQLHFHIHLFSASLSILVGITWLVLLALGKLEDVFP